MVPANHNNGCPMARQNSSTMRHTATEQFGTMAMQTPNRRSKHAHSLAPDGGSSNQYTHVTAPTSNNSSSVNGRAHHYQQRENAPHPATDQQMQVMLPGGQGIYVQPSHHSSGNKHRQHYQQHINNYLADNSGTYYVMRGSSD